MSRFLFFILCVLNATAISITDIAAFSHWQTWLSVGCVSGAYLCGAAKKSLKA